MTPTPRADGSEPGYQPTLGDQLGADGTLLIRARLAAVAGFVVLFPVLMAASRHRDFTARYPFSTSVVGASLGAWFLYWLQIPLPAAAGAAATAVTLTDGSHTPYEEQYSFQESLIARGRVAEGLQAYEQVIAEQPGRAAPRLRAAEHYAAGARDAVRAAALFREVRDMGEVSARDAVYASSRLADLYDGPLADPGRALVELRRIVERFPNSPTAAHAREAIPRLKARMLAERESKGQQG
jgi:hypothetical protein